MKILSFGAGMQSTALALMACENAKNPETPWPLVPVYDVVIFCDLGMEPPWVKDQVEFTRKACEWAGVKFVVLDSPLVLRLHAELRGAAHHQHTVVDDPG